MATLMPAAGSDKVELEVISPDRSTRLVPISRSPFLIGRGVDTGNHLPLDDPRISRQCAAIVTDAEGYTLEDRGYRRGIFVNGKKIDRHLLANGDVITFGLDKSYEIVFRSNTADTSVEDLLTRIGVVSPIDVSATGLHKLNLLLEATSLLHSQLPLESVLGTMLDHAIAITRADRGLLLEADSSGALQVRLGRSKGGKEVPSEGFAPSKTALRQALEQKRSVITEDLALADRELQLAQSIVAQRLRTVIAMPLYAMPRATSAEPSTQSERGHFLGVVYLDSRTPAAFSKLDRQILDALAMEAASILDNARLVERERERQRLEQEMKFARDIQQALIPHGFRNFPYFNVTGIHTPCGHVGGDYFDIFPLSDELTAFVVADISGHGMGAALLTTMLQGAFSGLTLHSDPNLMFNQVNRVLCEHAEVGRYATMFFGLLAADGHLEYINAGHPSPVLARGGQVTELYTKGTFPVGLVPEAQYTAVATDLQPGDTLVLFSDGVTEAEDTAKQLYGVARLCDALSGKGSAPLDHLQKTVFESIEKFTTGASQSDDITLLLIRFHGLAKKAAM